MRRFAIGLLLFLSLASSSALPRAAHAADFDACAPDARARYTPILQSQQQAKTLLFRIVRCHAPDNFIFGTMHSDAPDVVQKSAPVLARLPQLRMAAFEYIEPGNAAEIMQRAMFDPLAVKPLSAQLSAGEWEKLKQMLVVGHGLPEPLLEKLRPWAASVMMQMPKLEHDGVILDDSIKQAAQKGGLAMLGLETMQEQMDIFDGMSQPQQLTMLKDTLANLADLDAMNRELEDAYRRGDLPHIEKLGDAGFADIPDPALKSYLVEALLTRRNQRMAERADAELTRGGLLIAVGALHLPGREGILARLESAGYYVLPVP